MPVEPRQSGDPYAPRPREKIIVYVPKQYRETHLVDRLKDHAQRVELSPSAVVMRACEQFLAQRGGQARTGAT